MRREEVPVETLDGRVRGARIHRAARFFRVSAAYRSAIDLCVPGCSQGIVDSYRFMEGFTATWRPRHASEARQGREARCNHAL